MLLKDQRYFCNEDKRAQAATKQYVIINFLTPTLRVLTAI